MLFVLRFLLVSGLCRVIFLIRHERLGGRFGFGRFVVALLVEAFISSFRFGLGPFLVVVPFVGTFLGGPFLGIFLGEGRMGAGL